MISSAHADATVRTRTAPHSAVREGIIAGAIGATVVAAWFLGVDVVAGHPLRTPEVLGRALMSVLGPRGSEGAMTFIVVYTVFHYVAFALVGILASVIIHLASREPSILAGCVILFVAVEIGFYGLVGLLSEPNILGEVAWYQVLIGNLLAAVAMGWYLWHEHPELGRELDQALSGRA
ncbi:MAG TPA: hypothetical protein VHM30_09295 [Gemmatimonadaceae bacterium]|nr:hypothetical protein [Gemmatimonadaceae bacterium]